MLNYLVVLLTASICTWLGTFVVRHAATRVGLVDKPDARRKRHRGPIPLGGGVAVAFGWMVAVAVSFFVIPELSSLLQGSAGYLVGLAASTVCIVGVGLVDDRVGLRGRQKLLGQFAAVCLLLIFSGLSITKVRLFNIELDFGVFAAPITVFWLLGAINSVNLLDGIDGLASTLGMIFACALAAMCLATGRLLDAALAISLAGALIGFLRFNLPPASIFLGDAGSMLIGLLIGATAIHSALKGPATVALAAPLAILTIPIMDTAAAVIRRKLTGRSIYATDRGHMHHTLLSQGFSHRYTLLLISAGAVLTCSAAFFSVWLNNELFAGVSVIVLVALAVFLRLFGHAEFVLLRTRLLELTRSIVSRGKNVPSHRESAIKIQGTRDWDDLWQQIRDRAAPHVIRIKLDIDVPRLHEGFHARWEKVGDFEALRSWRLVLPILDEHHAIGKLEIEGIQDSEDPEDGMFKALALHLFVRENASKLLHPTDDDPSFEPLTDAVAVT